MCTVMKANVLPKNAGLKNYLFTAWIHIHLRRDTIGIQALTITKTAT